MAKALPTNTRFITESLLRSAVALQVAVYEFNDGDNDEMATAAVERINKEIDRLTRALRKTL